MTFSVTPNSPDPTGLTPSSSSPSAPALVPAPGSPNVTALTVAIGATPALDFTAAAVAQTRVSLEEFIQWMFQGANLGDRRVQVVDFVDPTLQKIEVTRGTGENYHVLTIRFPQLALYFTSWPYPAEVGAEVDIGFILPMFGSIVGPFFADLDAGLILPLSGTLAALLQTYTLWPAESVDTALILPQSGTLVTVLQTYTNWPAESVDTGLVLPQSGTLVIVLITYANWPAETLDTGLILPQSGTLV